LRKEELMVTIKLENRTVELDIDEDMHLDEDTLEGDLCGLAKKIAYYAEIHGETKADCLRCEANVKYQAARSASNIREKAVEDGVRVTEPWVKEQVRMDDSYQAVKKLFFRATAQATMVEGFYRALRDKANLGIALCYKVKEEIRVTGAKIS
jgi:hypothetical protein